MRLLLIVSCLTLLAACAASRDKHQQIQGQIADAHQDMARHQQQRPLRHVNIVERLYVAPFDSDREFKPAWWFEQVELFNATAMPFADLMLQLSREYGVNYVFDLDIPANLPVSLSFSGTLGGMIEQLAQQSKLHYSVKAEVLSWHRLASRWFDIGFIPDLPESNATLWQRDALPEDEHGESLAAQSGSRDQQQRTEQPLQRPVSPWQDLREALGGLLSSAGTFSLSQSSSSLYVHDFPDNIERIEQYIGHLNLKLGHQVALDVQIIEVRMSDNFDYGVNWNLVRRSLSGDALVNLVTGFPGDQFSDLAPTLLSVQALSADSRYAGSSALLQALEQQGKVSVVNSPRVVTLNNQLASIAITEQTTYLASSSTRTTANVGAETTLRPGKVVSGLNLQILPLLQDDQVLLQVNGSLSTLIGIKTVESNGSRIEAPNLLDKAVSQRAKVPLGTTLMLAGYKSTHTESRDSGLFGQAWLNGSKSATEAVTEVIILITPRRM